MGSFEKHNDLVKNRETAKKNVVENINKDTHILGIVNRMKKLDKLVDTHGVSGLKKRIGDRLVKSQINELNIPDHNESNLLKTYEKDVIIMDNIADIKESIDDIEYQLINLENEKMEDIKLIDEKYSDVMEYIEISKNILTEKYHNLLEEKLLNKSL